MAAYIRTLARMATRVSTPSSLLISRQAPAAAAVVARQYHAFRSTQVAFKGKKHAIVDEEEDEELEAELRELEREKRELEALERGEALGSSDDEAAATAAAEAAASNFHQLYNHVIQHTGPKVPEHELPRHTALYHLAKAVSTKDQAELLPQAVQQWRLRSLPISFLVGDRLIHAACKSDAPHVALQLLGDRETYGLSPGQSTVRRVVRSFVKSVAAAGPETEEALESLDGAFKTMAVIPYYNLSAADSSVYANLVRGSLLYGGEEGLRRATVTMDELLLIEGERETRLTAKLARELVASGEQLIKAYKEHGDQDRAQQLQNQVVVWKRSI